MRTGILGGTFDPIHIAHLHTAECALYQLDLDRVLILPAGDPWQKSGRFISPAADRVEMCRLALTDVDEIEVDTREAVRDGPTFTIDTLGTFPPEEDLFLILGADAAAGLSTWHRWSEVVERVTVAVAPRPGAAALPEELPRVKHIDMGLLEVSGTEIREMVRTKQAYRYLVTEPVHDYIESHGLYAEATEKDMVMGLNGLEDSP